MTRNSQQSFLVRQIAIYGGDEDFSMQRLSPLFLPLLLEAIDMDYCSRHT
jgi:hypothetical protein